MMVEWANWLLMHSCGLYYLIRFCCLPGQNSMDNKTRQGYREVSNVASESSLEMTIRSDRSDSPSRSIGSGESFYHNRYTIPTAWSRLQQYSSFLWLVYDTCHLKIHFV